MKIVCITPDMETSIIEVQEGVELSFLEAATGGIPEFVHTARLGQDYIMVVSGNGAIDGLPVNMFATWLYGGGAFIHGKAFFMKYGPDDEGGFDATPFNEDEVEYFINLLVSMCEQA